MATSGWFIAMLLALLFLIIFLIIVCIIKRNRGGKYVVHESEAARGRHDYPDEPHFHEYSQPYVYKCYTFIFLFIDEKKLYFHFFLSDLVVPKD